MSSHKATSMKMENSRVLEAVMMKVQEGQGHGQDRLQGQEVAVVAGVEAAVPVEVGLGAEVAVVAVVEVVVVARLEVGVAVAVKVAAEVGVRVVVAAEVAVAARVSVEVGQDLAVAAGLRAAVRAEVSVGVAAGVSVDLVAGVCHAVVVRAVVLVVVGVKQVVLARRKTKERKMRRQSLVLIVTVTRSDLELWCYGYMDTEVIMCSLCVRGRTL